MRLTLALALALLPLPALAWKASYEDRHCTLTHAEDSAEVRLTYDPSGPLYTISITAPDAWSVADVFGITFEGPNPLTITTNRQTLSNGNRTLTVTDTGFGNVLSGLADNTVATAVLGDTAIPFSLDGAAPEVAKFRDCQSAPTA